MPTTTRQEIKEIVTVHGIVGGGIFALFSVIVTFQVVANALTT
jgi:hypothetical protein